MKPKASLRRFFPLSAIMLAGTFAVPLAHATIYYWDGNNGTAGFGTASGTWAAPTTGTATAGWTTDTAGTTVVLANSVTTATTDALNFGNGSSGLAAGTITVSGTVDSGDMTFASGSGAIVLSGGTINLAATSTITLNNAADTISSVISGAATSLTKTGVGTLTLNGSAVNTYTGTTIIKGGTLALDFANRATPTDLINSGNALTFGGGNLTIKGKAGAVATSQTLGNVTVNSGGGSLLINPNGGTSTTLTLGTLTGTAQGSSLTLGKALSAGAGTVTITTTTNKDAQNIYGGRVVFADGTANTGYDWATTASAGPIYTLAAYTGYTVMATTGTDTVNSRITASATLTGALTTNSLKIENPAATQTLALGANLMTLTSGGLLVTGTNAVSITGTAGATRLTAGNGSGSYDLVVSQYNSGGLTIGAVIGDNGANATSVTKAGTGTLTLSGTNTFSGGFILNSGTVAPTSNSALGTGTLTINGGTFTPANSVVLSVGSIVINSNFSQSNAGPDLNYGTGGVTLNRAIAISVNHNATFGGTVSGAGGLTALDMTIASTSENSGGLVFTNATPITMDSSRVISSAWSGGTYSYLGGLTDGAATYGLTVSANTNVILAGTSTFDGALSISGTLQVGYASQTTGTASIAPSSITINPGGKLQLGDMSLATVGSISTSSTILNNGTFSVGGNRTYTQGTDFASSISGIGSVVLNGLRAAGVTLNGSNTYSGGTTVIYLGGGGPVKLNINSANAIGSGTLTLSQSGSNAATIDNTSGGAITLATNNAQAWNGPITFTGTNSLNLGTGAVTLANSPTVTVSANTLTIGGTVSGSGQTLTKSGAGTLTLNGNTTLGGLSLGGLTVSSGAVGGSIVMGSGTTLSVGTGTGILGIGYGQGGTATGTLDASAAASVSVNVANMAIGNLIGSGSKNNGTLNLGATNNLTVSTMFVVGGSTNIDTSGSGTNGTNVGALTTATSSTTNIKVPTFAVGYSGTSGFGSSNGTVTLGNGAAFNLEGSSGGRARMIIAESVGGGGNYNGTVDLSGTATGVANLKLNSLEIGKTTSGQAATGTLTLSNSASNVLDVNGTGSVVVVGSSGAAGIGTGTLTIGNLNASSNIVTTSTTVAAVLIGSKTGSGTPVGTLNLNGGTLTITTGGSGSAAIAGGGGTSNLNLDGGVTLKAGGSNTNWINSLTTAQIKSGGATIDTNTYNIGISQAFSGAGGLTKTGAGTLTLATGTTHSYTGATNVTGGTLVVNGNISTSSLTTVGTGATLQGTGTTGALTIAAGGFHNPGNSPGIQNVIGNYTMDGTLTAEILGLNPGTEHDQVNVTGAVDITGGSLVAAFSGTGYGVNNLIFILLNDSNDAISGTFSGLDQGANVITYDGLNWQISYNADSVAHTFTGTLGGNDIALMAVAAVPEPGAALIGSLGLLALLRRRRF